jgi:hypothetical protein
MMVDVGIHYLMLLVTQTLSHIWIEVRNAIVSPSRSEGCPQENSHHLLIS